MKPGTRSGLGRAHVSGNCFAKATKSGTVILRGGGDERAATAGFDDDAEDAFVAAGTEAAEAPVLSTTVLGFVSPDFLTLVLRFGAPFSFFLTLDDPAGGWDADGVAATGAAAGVGAEDATGAGAGEVVDGGGLVNFLLLFFGADEGEGESATTPPSLARSFEVCFL